MTFLLDGSIFYLMLYCCLVKYVKNSFDQRRKIISKHFFAFNSLEQLSFVIKRNCSQKGSFNCRLDMNLTYSRTLKFFSSPVFNCIKLSLSDLERLLGVNFGQKWNNVKRILRESILVPYDSSVLENLVSFC